MNQQGQRVQTTAIRYFRPDVLFAITPWHLAEKCGCNGIEPTFCDGCGQTGIITACGYTPPEGWRAETKERGPRCVECEEISEKEQIGEG